jgi:hypothetical protein
MCTLLWGTFSAREKSDFLQMQPGNAKRKPSFVFCTILSHGEHDFELGFTFHGDEYNFPVNWFAFTWTEGL